MVNEILNLQDLDNLKVRFVKSYKDYDPIELFKHDKTELLNWQFWNYNKKKSFKVGEIAIGFLKIDNHKWLLFDISKITEDLNVFNGVGYKYEPIKKYEKYLGRVIIRYENNSQNLIRKAASVLHKCELVQILEDKFDDDIFPGYENVCIQWHQLEKVINNSSWKAALKNQKGVYLITDRKTGKMYVGQASGENMIHGRWLNYIENGHGGNNELKKKDFQYIKDNFTYSILEIFKSTIDDNVILKRESWWKSALQSKVFGYNGN